MMSKNYYGFIYITTNNINGMKYIGQKSYSQKNWREYLGSGIHLKRAIKKYGKDNFTKEIIEECISKEELDDREQYWILYYDAVNNKSFYNIASGGDGGNTIAGYTEEQLQKYKQRKSELHKTTALKGEDTRNSKLTENDVFEIIKRLQNNDFNSDIANDYNVSCQTIDDIRQHKTWCHLTNDIEFDDISNRKRPHHKKVCQYDLEGKLINVYSSAREAEKETNIGFRLISKVCNGKARMSHGYIWRFEEDPINKYPIEIKEWKLYAHGC